MKILYPLLLVFAGASAWAQVINYPTGFTTANFSQYGGNGGANFYFNDYAIGAVSSPVVGTAVPLSTTSGAHASHNLNYQTAVDVRAFISTFTFVPSGGNIAFVIQNDLNPGAGQYPWLFAAGAGEEAGFAQYAGGANIPPKDVFAIAFSNEDALTGTGGFTYSSVQLFQTLQWPAPPGVSLAGYLASYTTNRISTSPVPMASPATTAQTSTGDTYSATITYDGSNVTLSLYDVTAGGSCPGSSCFTHTWTNVLIPEIVGSTTAYVGIAAGTNGAGDTNYPVYVKSLVYSVNTASAAPSTAAWNANSTYNNGTQSAASPVYSVAPGNYSSAQTVSITTSGTPYNYICYVLSAGTPTLYPQPDNNGGCAAGTLYSSPVSIPSTSTLYAMAGSNNSAFATGTTNTPGLGPPSTLVAGTYTIIAAVGPPSSWGGSTKIGGSTSVH